MKIEEIIEKNKDFDDKVSICLKDPEDLCDPMSERIFEGILQDVPDYMKEYEVIDTGWLVGAKMIQINCFIPEQKHVKKYVASIWRRGANTSELKDYYVENPNVLMKDLLFEELNVPFPDVERICICDEKGFILLRQEISFRI